MLTTRDRALLFAARVGVGLLAYAIGVAVSVIWKVPTHSLRQEVGAEEYAVYSAVINHIHNEDRLRFLVIRDHSIACSRDRQWCQAQQIKSHFPRLNSETLEDYRNQNRASALLQNSFTLRASPITLSDTQLLQLLVSSQKRVAVSSLSSRAIDWSKFYGRYALSPGLITLSKIGFNNQMNQALVYEETQGNDNGTWGRYLVLTNHAGIWTVQSKWEAWFPEEPRPSVKHGEFGTLKGAILDAKADGQDRLELSVLACGWEIGRLHEILPRDTILVAQLAARKTYKDTYGLHTWYKFRIVEYLSQRSVPKYFDTFFPDDGPADMRPVAENEFLIRETNGQMEIDDVMVVQRSNSPEYVLGKTYLLFLWLKPSRHIAVRAGTDPLGVFYIENDGNLRAYLNRPYPLQRQLATRYGNSLDRLRNALKH